MEPELDTNQVIDNLNAILEAESLEWFATRTTHLWLLDLIEFR
ncbi:MAG: hypothetical protein CM15mP49_25490 [Actinomycetota bacterium]|nr:MAG: hypothetical protein CM15mP49_25490 [Actinomycetota bacterium]